MSGNSKDQSDAFGPDPAAEGYSWHTEQEVSAWLATFAAARHEESEGGASFSIGE